MKRNFIEVMIKAELDSDELWGKLNDSGFLGGWEEESTLHIYWPEDGWDASLMEELKRVLSRLGVGEQDMELTVKVVEDQDWNATWAASLEPIRLGRNIRIRQSWHPPDPEFSGIELVIDPRRAFGTGYHATTQLVMEWLEGRIRGGERVLDIGTGSGILSMVAIRMGAASALGVDIDPVAIECAGEYSTVNGFGPELKFAVASFEALTPGGYDVVLANIDGRTLPSLCSHLPRLMKESGVGCYSGLQEQDYEEVAEALMNAGFRITSKMQKEDWFALEIKALHV